MSLPGRGGADPMRLCPCVRERYLDLMEACRRDGVFLTTIETWRDWDRQVHYVAHGVSQTMNSLHLPQPPYSLSLAVDACPTRVLVMKGWAPGHPDWLVYTAHARSLGLSCGADWAGRDKGWDWPHVELKGCRCPAVPSEPKVLTA